MIDMHALLKILTDRPDCAYILGANDLHTSNILILVYAKNFNSKSIYIR